MIRQSITINDNGLFGRLEDYPVIIEQENRNFLEIVMAHLLRLVRDYTPVGSTGLLSGSISSEIQGQGISLTGILGTPLPYAESVEKGTKTHWVPIEPLKLWAMQKFGDEEIAWAVRSKIAKVGTKGHFMFKKALEQAGEFITQQEQALCQRITNRIGR
jgi:hypothetical protein